MHFLVYKNINFIARAKFSALPKCTWANKAVTLRPPQASGEAALLYI